MTPRPLPETRRMTFDRAELHTMTVALMIAVDQVGRNTDGSREGLELRADLLPKMRSLLDRFSD